MKRYVILNADDFGICHSQNLAIMELFRCGGISSSTIMTHCPGAEEAAAFARENPQFAVGVHLTTTDRWPPLTEKAVFYPDVPDFERQAVAEDILEELRAQIEKLMGLGVKPSHLDNHMGSLYGITTGRFDLLRGVIGLAGEYGLPFRFPARFSEAQYRNQTLGVALDRETVRQLLEEMSAYAASLGVATPDYLLPGDWNGPQRESFANYRDYIFALYRSFEPGAVTETYIHPSLEGEDIKGITANWQRRVWEYELFKDPSTHRYFNEIGIFLIDYKRLAAGSK
ncbi:MAG: ChbG/HpnK family deacetylase [Clostridia bacterium]|nr:ChbG/HpnK family deacetylase [Clostridia bacterium]